MRARHSLKLRSRPSLSLLLKIQDNSLPTHHRSSHEAMQHPSPSLPDTIIALQSHHPLFPPPTQPFTNTSLRHLPSDFHLSPSSSKTRLTSTMANFPHPTAYPLPHHPPSATQHQPVALPPPPPAPRRARLRPDLAGQSHYRHAVEVHENASEEERRRLAH
jgi:hypothetical protein